MCVKIICVLLILCSLSNASASCSDMIINSLCIVDPVNENDPYSNQYSRPCLPGGEKYEKIFRDHYKRSSSLIRKMYCSLEKIWIENDLHTTAYAVPIRDESNKVVAGAIGISRKFLDENPSLQSWMEKKENSSFGGSSVFKFQIKTRKKISAVDYALNHEFGHLFDYANDIQKSWTEIKNIGLGPIQKELCFYQCGGNYIAENRGTELMNELLQSTYVSTYASVNSKEDWAETFALYYASSDKGLQIKTQTSESQFDLHQHMNSDVMSEKLNFYRAFIKGSIRYPADP